MPTAPCRVLMTGAYAVAYDRSMTDAGSQTTRLPASGFAWLGLSLVAMWVVEVVDAGLLADRLESQGIQPRTLSGLDGILWAPFLHGSIAHLAGNSLPFAVLGGLVAIRGRRRWFDVTATILVVSGLATWLLARSGNHIGASAIVFGYLGYLVGSAVFDRNASSIVAALIAVVLYGGLVFGLLPQSTVSWEGHLFGLLAGWATAALARRRK